MATDQLKVGVIAVKATERECRNPLVLRQEDVDMDGNGSGWARCRNGRNSKSA